MWCAKHKHYTTYLRVCWYGAVCWDPYWEGQVSALNRVQKRATKFANNIHESSWETLDQRRLIARICALFKTYTGRRAWKGTWNRLLKPWYLSSGEYNRKIRNRKQRIDAGIYSFENRTIKSWNQLPASLLASFPCKLNTFRKKVKNVVTSKGIQLETECVMWSVVMLGERTWFMRSDFILNWS